MTRAYYDTKPPKLEAVGNGNYLYRWDIQEEEVQHEMMQEGKEEPVSSVKKVQYSCREVTIHGKPEYGKCVEAIPYAPTIRQKRNWLSSTNSTPTSRAYCPMLEWYPNTRNTLLSSRQSRAW